MAFPERRSTPTTTDIVKLETEINSLKRQLIQAKRDRAAAPSVDDTLRRLMVSKLKVFKIKSLCNTSFLMSSNYQFEVEDCVF